MLWLSINIIALFSTHQIQIFTFHLFNRSLWWTEIVPKRWVPSFMGVDSTTIRNFSLVVISIIAATEAIRRYLESLANHHKKLMTLKIFLSLARRSDARERSHSFNYIAKRIQNTLVNLFAEINFDFVVLSSCSSLMLFSTLFIIHSKISSSHRAKDNELLCAAWSLKV